VTTESRKNRKLVDIFWERQGWYFYDGSSISKEYEDLDDLYPRCT